MRPKQKVVVYKNGVVTGPVALSLKRNHTNAKYSGANKQCPRCMRMLKNPERAHKSDPYNKIPCLPQVTDG